MKFHIITLGCNKNTSDSEQLALTLTAAKWVWTPSPEDADLVLINTCGFISDAKSQSIETVLQMASLKEKHPNMKLGVFGCCVKRYHDTFKKEFPEIDYLFDFIDSKSIANILNLSTCESPESFSNPDRFFTPSHIGFLKIAEGCNNKCTYCAIPGIRGPFTSLPEEEILSRAKELASTGTKELSVVAQDITAYGTDVTGKQTLPSLVKKLSKIEGIEWIRLHYMHPRGLTTDFIDELFSIDKVVPYFDIPFQHVSKRLIKLMNRHTTLEHMMSLYDHIKQKYPEGVFRTTFIVGFPGETKKDFDLLIDFIEEHPIDRLGAFMYSKEEGTPGALLPHQCRPSTKQKRLDQLMTLQQLIAEENNQKLIGKKVKAIVDSIDYSADAAICRTMGDSWEVDNTLTLPECTDLKPGQIVEAKINFADAYDFTAELVK